MHWSKRRAVGRGNTLRYVSALNPVDTIVGCPSIVLSRGPSMVWQATGYRCGRSPSGMLTIPSLVLPEPTDVRGATA